MEPDHRPVLDGDPPGPGGPRQGLSRATGRTVALRAMGVSTAARSDPLGRHHGTSSCSASGVMARLEAEGHLVAGSRTAFVRSGIAVAVPAGASHPDIHDEAALRRAILACNAPAIPPARAGPPPQALRALSLTDEIVLAPIQAPPGTSVAFLVRGRASLGFQQLQRNDRCRRHRDRRPLSR